MTQKRRKPEGDDDMTHEELLVEIDRRIERVNETFYKPNTGALKIRDLMIFSLLALRAVVELHKPDERNKCSICLGIWNNGSPLPVPINYPCTTIQAIEKEVK